MLHEPLTFRSGLRVESRTFLSAMTNKQSHADGTLSEEEHTWLVSRARGGFGFVETCAAHVAEDGRGWPGELGVFDDRLLPGLTRLAASIHAAGPAAFVQIFHGGLRADVPAPWSAVAGEKHRAATTDDLERVIGQFGDAAARARAAGFDGVEIHGAHGYLLTQFLSAENVRADGWGGALPGRARLVREITREVRRRTAPEFTVLVRLSVEDRGSARGLDLDESLTVARWLAEDGADGLHLSLWDAHANTRKRPDVHPVPLFREALPEGVRILVTGSLWTRADVDALLARGADAVGAARAAIVNPEWARHLADPAWEPRRPPVTIAELRAWHLSPTFAEYMRAWKGFVTE